FLDDPNLLKELIEMGCISQVTASSIVGDYTEEIRQAAHYMMKENLINVIASDAHDTIERPFNLIEAQNIIEAEYGVEYKDYIVNILTNIFNYKKIKILER